MPPRIGMIAQGETGSFAQDLPEGHAAARAFGVLRRAEVAVVAQMIERDGVVRAEHHRAECVHHDAVRAPGEAEIAVERPLQSTKGIPEEATADSTTATVLTIPPSPPPVGLPPIKRIINRC